MPVRDLLMSAAGASGPATYVEDVFSTYLYTGTGATQSITNGIDLATKGGLVWLKDRTNAYNNGLYDTVRGTTKSIGSNLTTAQVTDANSLTAFNSNGFTLGTGNTSGTQVNTSTDAFASWTFRKQPKFFDVVQYTGTGANQAINHNLGSVPGCIMVKSLTNGTNGWYVYHKGMNDGVNPEQYWNQLNSTSAQHQNTAVWNDTAPTSTQFTVGTSGGPNGSGQTFIAYIFADQAGGFGSTGTDSAIACGSYTGTGATTTVSLGWEPQYVLVKRTDATGAWTVQDVIREMAQTSESYLSPNTTSLEGNDSVPYVIPTATGFNVVSSVSAWNASGGNYIYIAIRRPMKVPTDATKVFSPVLQNCNPSAPSTVTTGFPVDLSLGFVNSGATYTASADRLRGSSVSYQNLLYTQTSNAEDIYSNYGIGLDSNTTIQDYHYGPAVGLALPTSYWSFKRASGFFDVVCYTGTGSATTQAHNLTVAPEMMIVKSLSAAQSWWIYHSATGNTKYSVLNTTAIPVASSTAWNNTTPTSSVFSIGTGAPVNTSAATYVAYLFATCAGVSKVGSFTGTGGTQSIACGFGSGGARFVLIKRTDSTGDWYCFDSANGLTSSSSPYLLWNTTAAQTTGNNGCYASSGGFTLTSSASSTVNINGGSYIFLAVA